ncbi:MAG: thiamine pyrophosphate-dependent enzyme [Fervidicoccaceae archaeon]
MRLRDLALSSSLKRRFLREDRLPTIFCAGCGIGTVLKYVLHAIDLAELDPKRLVWISGIGCSSRVTGYVKFDSLHTTHGRALAFATGVKLARPDLEVLVFAGDGDLAAIGGNHLFHAARRNLDVVVVVVNNFNYGMTGGQTGPTTPTHCATTSAPRGNFERPTDLVALVAAAGANYAARWTFLDYVSGINSLLKAFKKKRGFRLVEFVTPCPTYFGRLNGLKSLGDFSAWLRKNFALPSEEPAGRMRLGELADRDEPGFVESYFRHAMSAISEELAGKSRP